MAKIKGVLVLKADAPLVLTKPYQERTRKTTVAEQRKIDKCLNCTKPARECKGDCV